MNNYEISPELFEEVTECGYVSYYPADYNNLDRFEVTYPSNFLEGSYDNDYITVNELFFMCKEWAYGKGYLIDSRTTTAGSAFLSASPISNNVDIDKTFVDFDEIQAVFKACDWLYNYLKESV